MEMLFFFVLFFTTADSEYMWSCSSSNRGFKLGCVCILFSQKRKKKTFPWCILISQTPCLLFYSPLHPSLSLFFSSVQGLPGLVCYHACMHHGPANKLHRVATPLPLSLSCQVEPLKRPSSTPLHSHPSIYLTSLLLCWHILAPAYTLDLPPIPSTCAAISAAGGLGLVSLWHSHHPSIHPSISI